MEVRGKGFGKKKPAAPLVWADFNNGLQPSKRADGTGLAERSVTARTSGSRSAREQGSFLVGGLQKLENVRGQDIG